MRARSRSRRIPALIGRQCARNPRMGRRLRTVGARKIVLGEGELRLSGAFRAVVPNGLNRGGKLRRPTLHARKGQKVPFYSQNVTRLSGSVAKPLADYSRDRPYEVAASGEVPTASCVIWVVVSHGHVLSAWSWMQFHERRGMRAVTVQLGCRGGAGCGACAPALERASTCVRARPQR